MMKTPFKRVPKAIKTQWRWSRVAMITRVRCFVDSGSTNDESIIGIWL